MEDRIEDISRSGETVYLDEDGNRIDIPDETIKSEDKEDEES